MTVFLVQCLIGLVLIIATALFFGWLAVRDEDKAIASGIAAQQQIEAIKQQTMRKLMEVSSSERSSMFLDEQSGELLVIDLDDDVP
jgi:hypothetical protein